MGHRWVVDQGVCDHFERLIEVMERKEGWKEGREMVLRGFVGEN